MRDVSTARHVQSFDRIAIVKLGAIRKLLAISAICNLEFHQIDIGSAFLVVELEEALCMENPEGFEIGEKPGSVEWGGRVDDLSLCVAFRHSTGPLAACTKFALTGR
jgi:hypothetical protein